MLLQIVTPTYASVHTHTDMHTVTFTQYYGVKWIDPSIVRISLRNEPPVIPMFCIVHVTCESCEILNHLGTAHMNASNFLWLFSNDLTALSVLKIFT